MMLRCRTMFQRSQFNDVVEFLTPKLLQKTFPNYLRYKKVEAEEKSEEFQQEGVKSEIMKLEIVDMNDIEQTELHLPKSSRTAVELMRAHSLFRSLVLTFWHQVQQDHSVSISGYDSIDLISKLEGTSGGNGGRATGQVGAIVTSTIDTSVLETAILLLSSSHERLARMSSTSKQLLHLTSKQEAASSFLNDKKNKKNKKDQNETKKTTRTSSIDPSTATITATLDRESTRLKEAFEMLMAMRRCMLRQDWDSVRTQINRIDTRIRIEKTSREATRSTRRLHRVSLLSCSTFIEGELVLARRECQDRKCRQMLREALNIGAVSGTLNEPNYDTVNVSKSKSDDSEQM